MGGSLVPSNQYCRALDTNPNTVTVQIESSQTRYVASFAKNLTTPSMPLERAYAFFYLKQQLEESWRRCVYRTILLTLQKRC